MSGVGRCQVKRIDVRGGERQRWPRRAVALATPLHVSKSWHTPHHLIICACIATFVRGPQHTTTMAPISLVDIVSSVSDSGSWGPPETKETMLNGVPYAPYSKSDKLGRMADWTEGKDRDRQGRQNYGGRNYRGTISR